MAATFVGALGAFPDTWSGVGDSTTGQFSNLTGNITSIGGEKINFDSLWLYATGGIALGGVIILGILTQSTNLIGVWIFGTVFWMSWIKIQGIFYVGGLLSNTAGIALVGMLWLGMMFMFVGAIIGMLSQSGGMR